MNETKKVKLLHELNYFRCLTAVKTMHPPPQIKIYIYIPFVCYGLRVYSLCLHFFFHTLLPMMKLDMLALGYHPPAGGSLLMDPDKMLTPTHAVNPPSLNVLREPANSSY